MFEDLFTALARVVRGASGDVPDEGLVIAVREAGALVGADLIVVRLPNGISGPLDIRVPEESVWPPVTLLDQWHAEVSRSMRLIQHAVREPPGGLALRHGVVLPIFSATGVAGVVGAFTTSRAGFTREQSVMLALLVQGAFAHTEAARLRRRTDALLTTEVHERVAREIHDGPLQMLSGIILHLRLARETADQKSSEKLQDLENELEQAIKQTRALIRNLRVAYPKATIEERLRTALSRLQQAQGLSWALQWQEPEGALAAPIADEIFAVINEALANVYRHSSAKHVDIQGRVHGDVFEVTVRDDGIGFDVAEALRQDIRKLSFGLISMQERMMALGGMLTLRSQSGRGTRVLISLPLGQGESGKSA